MCYKWLFWKWIAIFHFKGTYATKFSLPGLTRGWPLASFYPDWFGCLLLKCPWQCCFLSIFIPRYFSSYSPNSSQQLKGMLIKPRLTWLLEILVTRQKQELNDKSFLDFAVKLEDDIWTRQGYRPALNKIVSVEFGHWLRPSSAASHFGTPAGFTSPHSLVAVARKKAAWRLCSHQGVGDTQALPILRILGFIK